MALEKVDPQKVTLEFESSATKIFSENEDPLEASDDSTDEESDPLSKESHFETALK